MAKTRRNSENKKFENNGNRSKRNLDSTTQPLSGSRNNSNKSSFRKSKSRKKNKSNDSPQTRGSPKAFKKPTDILNCFLNPQKLNDLINTQNIEQVSSYLITNMDFYGKAINSDYSDEILIQLIKLTAKTCQMTFVVTKSYMLKLTMQKQFNVKINAFLSKLIVNQKKNVEFWQNIGSVLNDLITIMENALQLIPMTSWENVKTILSTVQIILPVLQKEKHILVEFEQKIALLQEDIIKIQSKFNTPIVANDSADISEVHPETDDYRYENIYPTATDLTAPERAYVRKNIVKGEYTSFQQYVDIHFRLLRADFFNPIREDICDFINKSSRRLFNIKVYKNVVFLKKCISKFAVCFQIKIELPKRIQEMLKNKENMKRFMHGTLLLFSDNNFTTFFCGRVLNADELRKGLILIDVPFNRPQLNKSYSMIECVVFFEPYYQILNVLQRIPQNMLPMEKYILKVQTDISHPQYMKNINYHLPPGLNPSQVAAFHAALNKEFVIIQGPPGTGKTFLGINIVQKLLELSELWKESGPILIICYTNHALEQFLQGLYQCTDKIVRIGRQCKDLQKANLKYGSKADSKAHYRTMMEYEEVIEIFKNKIEKINRLKNKAILYSKVILEDNGINLAEDYGYVFNDIEFLCWLLCDDGTIQCSHKRVRNTPTSSDSFEEADKIYDLLSNFIYNDRYIYTDENVLNLFEMERIWTSMADYLYVTPNTALQRLSDYLLEKIDYLKMCLKTDFGDPEVNFNDFPHPFLIPSKHRWQFYKSWVKNYEMRKHLELDNLYDKYEQKCKMYNDHKEMQTVKLLKQMDIVGMTTTCAARLRSTLEAVGSPIVVVEEAAEVLESHIVTTLTKHCQHLILLGDHQQLKPSTSDHVIQSKYKLGVSLFERMVNNNVQCHTLNVQHRMRPEMSSLITPLIYKDLSNSESVTKYPPISGVDTPLYFIDHTEPEETYGDSSKMNRHEAQFLIELAVYFLNNNYNPKDITILATYLGQSYILQKERDQCLHPQIKNVNVTVVDNFQGEENKIILLSLVRSNEENKVGFLATENRVCVALSRAREGLFIMGNMTQLCKSTKIWRSIRTTLKSQNAIGRYLQLNCKNHKHVTLVSKASDFSKVPEGGCTKSCDKELTCGHICKNACHGYDINHEDYKCTKSCVRVLCDDKNHRCKKLCYERCGPCKYSVIRSLPCGHKEIMFCSQLIEETICYFEKEIEPLCGHVQVIPCYKDNGSFICKVVSEKLLPKCGHTQNVPCDKNVETYRCRHKVNKTLICDHKMMMYCSDPIETVECHLDKEIQPPCGHIQVIRCCDDNPLFICKVISEKVLPKCGHTQNVPCNTDMDTYKCEHKVNKTLNCGHIMETKCYALTLSSEQERKKYWLTRKEEPRCLMDCKAILSCGHVCLKKCHKNYDAKHRMYNCLKPCKKNMARCNNPKIHPKCQRKCGTICNPCDIVMYVFHEKCQHWETILCFQATKNRLCYNKCNKRLTCGHMCPNRCRDPCGPCNKYALKVLPECGHKFEAICGTDPSPEDCMKSCTKALPCGHNCTQSCNQPCTEVCTKKCKKVLSCGHKCINSCNEDCACKTEFIPEWGYTLSFICGDVVTAEPCLKRLESGSCCKGKCNEPGAEVCQTIKASTSNVCIKMLECGHLCQKLRDTPCTPVNQCQMPCIKTLECGHPCKNMCSKPCEPSSDCKEICQKKLICGHLCGNPCNKPCNMSCHKNCVKVLDCGHICKELCKDECICSVCCQESASHASFQY